MNEHGRVCSKLSGSEREGNISGGNEPAKIRQVDTTDVIPLKTELH